MDDARLLIDDDAWDRIRPALATLKSQAGAPPDLSDRLFLEAVLYRGRTGGPWRDLPARFGAWDAVYQRFRRWQKAGRFADLFARSPADSLSAVRELFVDSTIIRAHPHAAGAAKVRGGAAAQGLGRSCGGFSTKLHVACADEDTALAATVTAGQRGDAPLRPVLLEEVPEACPVESVAADVAYDSDANRARLADRGIEAVIPSRARRKEPIGHDRDKYKRRNKVERFFAKRKQFRGVATRYDKLAETFLALVHLVAAFLMIR
jgi:transposase